MSNVKYKPSKFEEACKTAKIGKIVGPVKTQFGYHIIRVDERIPTSGTKPFEDVKEDIRNQLLTQKQKEHFEAYKESLLKEFNVKIYLENL